MKWKCPKCGRELSCIDQQHCCGKPSNVDEYISAQDELIQPKLQELRAIFKEALPDVEETMAWSMPTYRKGVNLIHFAAFKKHIGIYPGGEATTFFAEELNDYDTSKGTIRLPNDKPLPKELLTKIARWCYEKYAK